ncbi:DMT family transporter [uncultured Jannaschia sp.]|uniref:DMT family transporter n=1 Tax=uncultured Jannaschia sp. TaxID=293347 RepID=UPI0026265F92|nr:DMT family transporter [uncultured Jannaschia sp.]
MTQPSSPLQGILWMLLTGVLFVMVTAVVKFAGENLPAAESAFLRYLIGFVFLIPFARSALTVRMPARQVALFAGRGLVHAIGVMCWFYSMTQIPIAEVTAMNYLNPVYVTLGAAMFLGERLAWPRICAVLAALAGTVVILRPGLRAVEMGHLTMLVTAALFGASYLLAKPLSDRYPAGLVVAMLSVFVTLGLAPFAIAVWVTPTVSEVFWMGVVALFATAGHYTMTRAFAAAPVSVTQPATFLQLIWAVLLGWAFFEESPDLWVVVGATIIILSVTFIAWRESRRSRAITPPSSAAKF